MRLGIRPEGGARCDASRSRGSTDRRPGRCRSRRPARPARRDTLRNRRRRLRPVGEALVRIERRRARRARLSGTPRCRACTTRSRASSGAVASTSAVGDERSEHDPRAVPARDQHRVLAVEADAGARCGLAVDVLVRVHEHAVLAAEPAAELLEPLAQQLRSRRATCSARAFLLPARAAAPARSSSSAAETTVRAPGRSASG